MDYEDIFDTTVPQRAVAVTRTTRYVLPVNAKATIHEVAALNLGDQVLARYDSYTDVVSVSEAPIDDVVLAADGFPIPPQPLLDAASSLLPTGDGDLRQRVADAAEQIRARRRG